eukprot:9492450-Pyramimonas_sp.AAC.1
MKDSEEQIAMRNKVFAHPSMCILDVLGKPNETGLTIRVHKDWAMDRALPATALLRCDHIDAPFCMEHASQRVTEYLLNIIQ